MTHSLLVLAHVVGAIPIGGAATRGAFTPELERARAEQVPAFTHFLDLPLLLVIVALGLTRPASWTLFVAGSRAAVAVAAILRLCVPRLYRHDFPPAREGTR